MAELTADALRVQFQEDLAHARRGMQALAPDKMVNLDEDETPVHALEDFVSHMEHRALLLAQPILDALAAAERERDALKGALRERVLSVHTHPGTRQSWHRCAFCWQDWDDGTPEQHEPGCLAALAETEG